MQHSPYWFRRRAHALHFHSRTTTCGPSAATAQPPMPSMAPGAHVVETALHYTTIAIVPGKAGILPRALCCLHSPTRLLHFITISLCSSAGSLLIQAVGLPWLGLRTHSPKWWSACRQRLQILATLLSMWHTGLGSVSRTPQTPVTLCAA